MYHIIDIDVAIEAIKMTSVKRTVPTLLILIDDLAWNDSLEIGVYAEVEQWLS